MLASEDSDAVRVMREAGAIPMCVTNVSELCMWWESSNTIYGRTNNPYNTSKIVGGSSGGEVSVVLYLPSCIYLLVIFIYLFSYSVNFFFTLKEY